MDNKIFKKILDQAVLFLAILLGVQFIFSTFFSSPAIPKTGLQFQTSNSKYSQNNQVIAKIENYTPADITIKNPCPAPAIQTEYLENGQWTSKTSTTATSCEQTQDIVIKSGASLNYSFKPWNHDLFGTIGHYRLKLTVGDQTLESNQFQITSPSFLSWFYTTFIHQPIYNALTFFIQISPGNSLGWGIILLTILIRTILLIPNHKVLKSQKKLQSIQPKISALKDKHGDNKEKIAQETFAIYKEHKVSPFGSCLPLLIQLPILIGLYNVIQNGIDPGSKYLLYGPLQNFDLNKVQNIFLGLLDLTKVDIFILPISVGILQYISLRLSMGKKKTPKNASANEMEAANKTMMYIMPVMIAFFTASSPAGVGLYWAFSTIYGIIQQSIINRHFQQAETSVKVVNGSKKADKKAHYQKINELRKQAHPTPSTIIDQSDQPAESKPSDDSDTKPPITIIKA